MDVSSQAVHPNDYTTKIMTETHYVHNGWILADRSYWPIDFGLFWLAIQSYIYWRWADIDQLY